MQRLGMQSKPHTRLLHAYNINRPFSLGVVMDVVVAILEYNYPIVVMVNFCGFGISYGSSPEIIEFFFIPPIILLHYSRRIALSVSS